MKIDDIDRELGGPMVVHHLGATVTLPAASELSWRVVAAAVMDPHYFIGYIWPPSVPLTAWKLDLAHDAWCRHNRLPSAAETRSLVRMVERYGDALEYDLRGRLQVSLGDLWRERRWRELYAYIQNLPRDTKLNARLADDEEYLEAALRAADKDRTPQESGGGPSMADWNLLAEQMATLIDAVNRNTEVTRAVAGGKPSQVKPQPRPRTAADRVRDRMARQQHEEMASILLRDRPNRVGMMQGSTPPGTM